MRNIGRQLFAALLLSIALLTAAPALADALVVVEVRTPEGEPADGRVTLAPRSGEGQSGGVGAGRGMAEEVSACEAQSSPLAQSGELHWLSARVCVGHLALRRAQPRDFRLHARRKRRDRFLSTEDGGHPIRHRSRAVPRAVAPAIGTAGGAV